MSNQYPIKINGIKIKTPTEFQISRYNLTKHGRVASGNMRMDLLSNGRKRKLFLKYASINGQELMHILTRMDVWSNVFFYVSFFDEDGQEHTMTCYVGEIPAHLLRRGTIQDHHMWKNVDFNLIER